jgi:hypothetical protein
MGILLPPIYMRELFVPLLLSLVIFRKLMNRAIIKCFIGTFPPSTSTTRNKIHAWACHQQGSAAVLII